MRVEILECQQHRRQVRSDRDRLAEDGCPIEGQRVDSGIDQAAQQRQRNRDRQRPGQRVILIVPEDPRQRIAFAKPKTDGVCQSRRGRNRPSKGYGLRAPGTPCGRRD